jgi:hypothetical protein
MEDCTCENCELKLRFEHLKQENKLLSEINYKQMTVIDKQRSQIDFLSQKLETRRFDKQIN